MSEHLQPGQHPDADQLSAFVEHALPAHEHQWMLAHLAVCPDCRSVVAVSMPPAEELPELQPVPVRKPWFSGWNLVWPVAAAFAALILIVMLVRKAGGNAPPRQIAEARLPEKPAVGLPSGQPGVPAAPRGAAPSPGVQDRSIDALQRDVKPAAAKGPAEPTIENQNDANLPLNKLPMNGRNIQSLRPSKAVAPPRMMGGMGGVAAAGPGLAQQAQVPGNDFNPQRPARTSAGAPAAAASTPAVNGLADAPPAASSAPASLPPPTLAARAGSGSPIAQSASKSAAGTALTTGNATSDDAFSAAAESNASSTVISGESLAALTSTGNVVLHGLPSGLPALSVATAGQTMLALDSGNALFLSSDAGTHWKRVRARWQGRAVKVALAVTPGVPTQQTVVVNGPAFSGELQGRISTAREAAASTPVGGGATLTGQVTDPTGAVIPGAAVTVTNAATASAVTVKTDAAGRYSAGGLAAGAYRINATAQGFATQERNVTLAASQPEKADLRLQVGQQTETVSVTSASPQIETGSASLSAEVVEAKPRKSAQPVFAITTDAGERWVSTDGRRWKRQ